MSRQQFVGKGYHLSAAQFRHEANFDAFEAQARELTAHLQPNYAALAAHPRNEAGVPHFMAYLQAWSVNFPVIMTEMCRRQWRRTYFARDQLKEKSLTGFFGAIKKGRAEDGTLGDNNVTMVISNGEFLSSQRGGLSAPKAMVVQAAVLVFGRANVYFEGEYLSSQMDAACSQRLVDVYTRAGPSRFWQAKRDAQQAKYDRYCADAAAEEAREANDAGRVPFTRVFAPRPPQAPRAQTLVRGLKYCANPFCPDAAHRLKDRDVNASRNILIAFLARVLGQPRPAYLCPAPRAPPGPKRAFFLPHRQ